MSDGSDNDSELDITLEEGPLSDIHKAFGLDQSNIPKTTQVYSLNQDVVASVQSALPDDYDLIIATDDVYDVAVLTVCEKTLEQHGDTVTTLIEERDAYIPLLVVIESDPETFWESRIADKYQRYIDDVITYPIIEQVLQNRLTTLTELYVTRFEAEKTQSELSKKEAELVRRQEVITVLQRVLRHNIRNDMSVVKGYAAMVRPEIDDPQPIDTIEDTVDKIVSMSERAHEVTQSLTTASDKRQIHIQKITDSAKETVESECNNIKIDTDIDPSINVYGYPSLETALVELLKNACEHTDDPEVEISAEIVENNVIIQVCDNGDGIPNIERTVLEEGLEKPLEHGSGLGLWMVNWVVKDHNGKIDVETTNGGTIISIQIPRL